MAERVDEDGAEAAGAEGAFEFERVVMVGEREKGEGFAC